MGSQQKIKEAAVKDLEKDIQALSATDLEYVGHSLIELIEGKSLIHRGVNRDGRPVGYTVDTFSPDFTVVGEYSGDQKYFEKPYSKPRDDCQHALGNAPKCRKLYLMSSMACNESVWPMVSAAVGNAFATGNKVSLEIYDSRRLAEAIYEQVIVKNSRVEYFSDFLPSLWTIWQNNLVCHNVPPLPQDYVEEAARTACIQSAFARESLVSIYGISGLGKSLAAAAYAGSSGTSELNTVWISGTDLAGLTTLETVALSRLGVTINLAARLRTGPCLVVIDDWKGTAEELAQVLPDDANPGTRILVTSIGQLGAPFYSVELPSLSDANATRLLESGAKTRPTEGQAKAIVDHTGGHPLTLKIVRDHVLELDIGWQHLVDDLANVPKYEDANQGTIIHRMLLQHGDLISDELQFLKWLGSTIIDLDFALAMIGPGGLAKLLRRSLMQQERNGLFRIHEVVFACLKHLAEDHLAEAAIERKMLVYFERTCIARSYHFRRTLQMSASKVTSWVDRDEPKADLKTYLFLLLESSPRSGTLIENLSACELATVVHDRFAVLAVIEAMERFFLAEDRKEEKEGILAHAVANLTRALGSAHNHDIRMHLLHHRGKFLRWQKRDDEALADFKEELRSDAKAFRAHLHVARIQAQRKDSGSTKHLEAIFNAFEDDEQAVSITILLAALTELEKKPNRELLDRLLEPEPRILQRAVNLAVCEGFSQPYRALGRLSRYISYLHPTLLLELADLVTFPVPDAVDTDEECFEIAECMKNAGKACADLRNDGFAQRKWLERAMGYYNRVSSPNSFQQTMKAECLIRLGQFTEALNVLDAIEAPPEPHRLHRRAQALLGLKRYDESVSKIDEAIDLLGKRKDDLERYKSAFLHTKARALAPINAEQAIDVYKEAVDTTTNEKYRADLRCELEDLKARNQ